jgi:predicted Zn-dependent peptidase
VIDETRREIERLRQEPVPHDELDVVKRHMLSDMVKTLDTPFNIASYIGNMFCYGTYPTYFNEHIEAIDKCTSEQLLQVAQRYLNLDQLRIVIACDKNQLPQQEF